MPPNADTSILRNRIATKVNAPTDLIDNDAATQSSLRSLKGLKGTEVAIDGVIYDIADFVHPGGEVIKFFGGNDVTVQYKMIHPYHTGKHLEKMKMVGKVVDYVPEYKFDTPFEREIKSEVFKIVRRGREFGTTGYFFRAFCYIAFFFFMQYTFATSTTFFDFNNWYESGVFIAVAFGVAQAFIGLNVQHDANHGAVSKRPWINDLLGFGTDLIGSNKWNWMAQHWTHHAYTNHSEKDPDSFSSEPMFAFNDYPIGHPKRKWHHKFQGVYFLFMLGMYWTSTVLNPQVMDLRQRGAQYVGIQMENDFIVKRRKYAIALRAMYIFLNIYSPFANNGLSWATFGIIMLMGVSESLTLSVLFSLSHNFVHSDRDPTAEFKKTGESICWFKSQVETSSTYGGAIAGYLSGGLNFQVEHHLFPRMSSAWTISSSYTDRSTMGKQSKRKNKKRGGNHHRPTGLADDPATTANSAAAPTSDDSPVAKITKKIRHGDPRVRHAALVALSRTLYDGTALERNAAKKRLAAASSTSVASVVAEANNPTLLQALSEKILDVDVPCATIAVGCLSNYVSFYCGGIGDGIMENDDVASDVMAPILLQRLQSSLGTIQSMMGQLQSAIDTKDDAGNKKGVTFATTTSTSVVLDKHWPSIKEQWSLLSLSLNTLAGLIENCPQALARLGVNSFPQLITMLPLARTSLEFLSKEIGAEEKDKKEDMAQPILDAVTNATRALHSLLDDNRALIASLPLGNSISELANSIITKEFPNIAKLHASGSILSLRRLLVLEKEIETKSQLGEPTAAALQSCTNDVVLPLLSSIFDSFTNDSSDDSPSQVLNQMIATSNELSTIKNDADMEDDVVSKVNARKEPTRDIAKRLKKVKQDKKKKQKEDADMDVQAMNEEKDGKDQDAAAAMTFVEEEGDSTENMDDTKQQQKEDDLQEELDKIVSNWKTIVGSHKLALELVANLCSGISGNGDDEEETNMYQDDDEHMWDSDDEAKLVADSKATNDNNANTIITPSEQATYNSMTAQHHLPEKVLQFFQKWVEFLPHTTNVPALVSQDVNEVLSTCALCLGNVLACNLSTWSSGGSEKNGLDFFWLQLVTMLSSSTKTTNPESTMSQHHAITSVMLSMLQNQPRSRTFIDESTLDGLFTLLLHADTDDEALMQMQCNIISILGVLCSEPHPALIDAKVCSALLQRLSRSSMDNTNTNSNSQAIMRHSVIITHEILNVLMDMYGDEDNCHDEVFEKENVLDHFRRCLPGFKRRIKKAGGEEANVWNETALNASRFIKYKQ